MAVESKYSVPEPISLLRDSEVLPMATHIHNLIMDAIGHPSKPPLQELIINRLETEYRITITEKTVQVKVTSQSWGNKQADIAFDYNNTGQPQLAYATLTDLKNPTQPTQYLTRIHDHEIGDEGSRWLWYESNISNPEATFGESGSFITLFTGLDLPQVDWETFEVNSELLPFLNSNVMLMSLAR